MGNPKSIPAYVHVRIEGNNFIQYAKFTLIEQIAETQNVTKATLELRLKLGGFRILKLNTLSPKGLNQELINV